VLSRIAESMYWIGRYIERAEDTARILDVHYHLLVEAHTNDVAVSYRTLLHAMGLPSVSDETDAHAVATLLIHGDHFDGSIAASIHAAWDNARGARETIPSELWECLNVTHSAFSRWDRAVSTPHETLRWVKERAAIAAGLVDTTMSRDEGWRFLVLGRSIERVDMTVRLLSARYGDRWGAAGWRVLLRSCSAHEAFLRRYRGRFSPNLALEFLLVDPEFPRSLVHSLRDAEQCVAALEGSGGPARAASEAHRLLAGAAAELSFAAADDLVTSIDSRLERLEHVCSNAHDAVTRRYFRAVAPIEWRA
jgi:uncharacterized alpha-E superfamily protein